MKVLQFIPSLNAYDGGTATYMQQLAPHLGAAVDLHVCVLTPLSDCVEVPGATLHSIELSLWHLRRMRRQWMALLEEILPDVLHVNCCWLPHCALVQRWTQMWSKEHHCQVSCFVTPHGMLEPWLISRNYWTKKVPAIWLYQRWAIKSADGIIATAVSERQHLMELGWCQPERIHLLPNGIDARGILPKSEWKEGDLNLLFMSRIHPKKGLELLLEAMQDVEGLRLEIAGDGEPGYIEQIKGQIAASGLSGRCTLLGPVYGEHKWELIRSSDIVVLPSHSENFGLIVAEALASGVPVLTTTGTPWQELKTASCGWWVEPTVEGLRTALQQVLHTTVADRRSMGERGRKLIEEKYDVSTLAGMLVTLYKGKN